MRAIFEMHVETIKMLLSKGLGRSYTQTVIDMYGIKPVFEAVGQELNAAGILAEQFTEPDKPLCEGTEDC